MVSIDTILSIDTMKAALRHNAVGMPIKHPITA